MTGRQGALAVAALVLTVACSMSPGVIAPPPTPAAAAPTSTTAPEVTSATTSTTTSTSTTTTTLPPLDRSDAAAIARMRADLDVLLSAGPRVSGTRAEEAAAWFLARTAAAVTGEPSVMQPVPLPEGAVSRNAWAAPVGTGGATLLIGAHLDSVAGSPGADDNASGVIITLELLRRLAESPPASLRVVVVGFGAEEWIGDLGHHFGSRVAAGEMAAAGTLPDWMLSIDMGGVGPVTYATDLRGFDTSFADLVAAAGAAAGIPLERSTRGEISDHEPFARAGVPSALLIRLESPGYHTPGDDYVYDHALLETLAVAEEVIARLDAGG